MSSPVGGPAGPERVPRAPVVQPPDARRPGRIDDRKARSVIGSHAPATRTPLEFDLPPARTKTAPREPAPTAPTEATDHGLPKTGPRTREAAVKNPEVKKTDAPPKSPPTKDKPNNGAVVDSHVTKPTVTEPPHPRRTTTEASPDKKPDAAIDDPWKVKMEPLDGDKANPGQEVVSNGMADLDKTWKAANADQPKDTPAQQEDQSTGKNEHSDQQNGRRGRPADASPTEAEPHAVKDSEHEMPPPTKTAAAQKDPAKQGSEDPKATTTKPTTDDKQLPAPPSKDLDKAKAPVDDTKADQPKQGQDAAPQPSKIDVPIQPVAPPTEPVNGRRGADAQTDHQPAPAERSLVPGVDPLAGSPTSPAGTGPTVPSPASLSPEGALPSGARPHPHSHRGSGRNYAPRSFIHHPLHSTDKSPQDGNTSQEEQPRRGNARDRHIVNHRRRLQLAPRMTKAELDGAKAMMKMGAKSILKAMAISASVGTKATKETTRHINKTIKDIRRLNNIAKSIGAVAVEQAGKPNSNGEVRYRVTFREADGSTRDIFKTATSGKEAVDRVNRWKFYYADLTKLLPRLRS